MKFWLSSPPFTKGHCWLFLMRFWKIICLFPAVRVFMSSCFVLFFSKCKRLDWNKTEVLWYCIRSGRGAVSFLHSIPHSAVLCIGSSKAVDNTAVLWLLPSSAHTASRLSPQHSFPGMLEVGRILWGDIPRTGDTNWLKGYSIPYDIYSAIKAKRKEVEGGHSLLRCLSSRASAMHIEALLPRNCLDITCWCQKDNKSFFLSFSSMHSLCFCFTNLPLSWPMSFFHLIFSPPCLAE